MTEHQYPGVDAGEKFVIYDAENHTAWVESTVSFRVEQIQ